METFLKIADLYGIPMMMIGMLSWFILYMAKSHRSERSEWRKDQSGLQKESNNVMRDLTKVITEVNIRSEERKRDN